MPRETVWAAIKKTWIFLAVFVVLFAAANWIKYSNHVKNLKKDAFVDATATARPTMTTREFLEVEATEGNLGVVLGETTRVGDEYFADAVFAGDSLTDGFRIYDVGQHFDVISKVGLSPQTATSATCFTTPEGEELIMADAIKYLGSRKAYILLGANGLNWTTPDNLIVGYYELVDQLMRVNPDTYIILQSIPPVTAATAAARPSYTQETVEYYNSLVKNLAMEKGIYFLDVYSAFVQEDGYLSTDIAAPDGMHLTPSGYKVWFDYISTHTIKGDAAFAMDAEGRIIPMKPADSQPEETSGVENGQP